MALGCITSSKWVLFHENQPRLNLTLMPQTYVEEPDGDGEALYQSFMALSTLHIRLPFPGHADNSIEMTQYCRLTSRTRLRHLYVAESFCNILT